MQTLNKGILIAIEGIDGSGKSTLAKNLAMTLALQGLPVKLTKEPGATQLGAQLRTILQKQPVPLTPKAEYLLFAADRAQHFHEIVIPELDKKNMVISDRLADSSVVYQGYGRGLTVDIIKMINAWAMNNIQPDLIVYIRISPDVALERLVKRKELTAFEQERAFTEKLVHGFDDLYKGKKHVILLDGTESPETLTNQAKNSIVTWIKQRNLLTPPQDLNNS